MTPLQHATCDRWLPLNSPAVSRLVALELVSTSSPHPLPDSIRTILEKHASANDATTGALRYLVLRQASYPLIQKLFRISRADWLDVRKEFNAPPSPRGISAKVADDIEEQIYTTWLKLCKEYGTEMDRWVMMGEAFKTLPLSSIYPLIYGGDAFKPGQM